MSWSHGLTPENVIELKVVARSRLQRGASATDRVHLIFCPSWDDSGNYELSSELTEKEYLGQRGLTAGYYTLGEIAQGS